MLIESITIIHYALNQGGYNMAIKAIMCDIDGTLLSSKGYVTDKTVEMIKKQEKRHTLWFIYRKGCKQYSNTLKRLAY